MSIATELVSSFRPLFAFILCRALNGLLIGLSFIFPAYAAAPEDVRHAVTNSHLDAMNDDQVILNAGLAASFRSLGSTLQVRDPQQTAQAFAQGAAQQHVSHVLESFLNQFGTADLRFKSGSPLSAEGGEFDFLLPVLETDDSLVFSQTGIRRADQRTMFNLGIGKREWFTSLMTGYNLFFDRDLSRQHSRLGAGIELMLNNVQFAGNVYLPLSSWKTSAISGDYLERPARGFDLHSEAWLPDFPALGGKIVYSRYYGNEVGVSTGSNRVRNPTIIDSSILYTPVPLITLEAGQRWLPAYGRSEGLFGFTLRYSPGTPLKQQLRADAVRQHHLLSGNRHDLVQRNNHIVLEYKKLPVITLYMPSSLSGIEETTIKLGVMLKSKHALAGIEWLGAEFFEAGGTITHTTAQGYQALLPAWKEGQRNQYSLKAIARDIKGNASEPAEFTLTVTREFVRISLAGDLRGEEGQTMPLGLNARMSSPVSRIEWNAASFIAAGGKIYKQTSRSFATASLDYYAVLPAFRPDENNTYSLDVTVWDSEGHSSGKENISITVTAASVVVKLPTTINASEGNLVVIAVDVTAPYGLERIDWQAVEFYRAGGRIEQHAGEYIATMPAWMPHGNDYLLTAVAVDKRGIISQPVTSILKVSSAAISLSFDGNIEAEEHQQVQVTPRVSTGSELARIDWQADSFIAAGGKIEVNESGKYLLLLPAWRGRLPDVYEISARAVDIQGYQSAPAHFSVRVSARTLTATLPENITAGEGEHTPLEIIASYREDVDSVDIHAEAFIAAGGEISGSGLIRQLILPPARSSTLDTYLLTVVLKGKNGTQSPAAMMHVMVRPRPLTLAFQGRLAATESTSLPLRVDFTGPFTLQRIEWQAERFAAAGGQINPTGEGVNLKLPAFIINGSNTYSLVATAVDTQGRRSDNVHLQVTVFSALVNSVGQCDVLGGGAGYTKLIDKNTVEYRTATDYPTLKTLTDRGEKYIYIPGDATIDIPNQSNALNLRSGTTLFSDRGRNGSQGGQLRVAYNGEAENKYAIIVADSDSRISGLRYEGPYKGTMTQNTTIGIQSRAGSHNIEIDNSELWGWPWAAVSLKQSRNIRVHHSYIHDNIRTERGYGVVTQSGDTSAEVACNIFDANRHAIAGEGKAGESYNAHHNLVLNGGGRGAYHQFDMHASSGGIAGEFIDVRENWFDYGRYGTSNRSSVLIRGQPTSGPIIVENNWFSQSWLNGSNKQVSGLYGYWVAPEQDIINKNFFNTALHYRAYSSDRCVMTWLNFSQDVYCAMAGREY